MKKYYKILIITTVFIFILILSGCSIKKTSNETSEEAHKKAANACIKKGGIPIYDHSGTLYLNDCISIKTE